MAKQNNQQTGASNAAASQASPPAGYKRQAQDVVGYWDPSSGPVHFVPRTVKLFDSNLEPNKPSILVIGVLIEPCKVHVRDDITRSMRVAQADRGDPIGVWYKAGMRALTNLCDAKVWMQQSGERDTGKPNPMKLFQISSPGPNSKFEIVIDEREQSAGVATDFCGPRASNGGARSASDDLPF